MKERNGRDAELRGLLRRGDPARDLGPEESAHLRGVILRAASQGEARETSRRLPRRGLAWATAASVAVAVVLGWNGTLPDRSVPPAAEKLAQGWTVHTGAAPGEPLHQQVQFTTPGGTRVIWILNPDPNQDRSGR
jgi:hypothetical protein